MNYGEKQEIVLRTISIYDVLNAYAPRKITSSGMCCCPIHNEEHPSCKVYDGKKFRCFACGQHGNIIDITKKLFSLDYKKALDKLANDFGISEIISAEERRAIERKQKAEEEKRAYELKQKAIVREYTDKLSDQLILSRKKCSYWYRKPILTESEMELYSAEKQRIKDMEKIYIEINKLDLQHEPKKTSVALAEYKNFLESL